MVGWAISAGLALSARPLLHAIDRKEDWAVSHVGHVWCRVVHYVWVVTAARKGAGR